MKPNPKARSLVLKLAMVGSSLDEERTTLFALGALMMMFPMTVVIIVIVVLPMLMMVFPMVVVVERRLLQRQSKRSTEDIDNLQRLGLGLDTIMEPVTSPSTRAVMLHCFLLLARQREDLGTMRLARLGQGPGGPSGSVRIRCCCCW